MASKMSPKRKVNVRGQKHSLAYINDREKRMLRQAGGSGKPGPNGIPTYFDVGEGAGGYDSGGFGDDKAADTAGGRGDPDAGRDDGGSYSDSQTGRGGNDRGNNNNYSVNPFERSRVDTAKAAAKARQDAANKARQDAEKAKADRARADQARADQARADAVNKTRTTARAEVQARIDKLSSYSESKDTNFINRYAAKANVMGAQRVADKLSEKGSIAIRDKSGQVVGAMHDGLFGRVYSGRMLDKDNYNGPAEFANQVTMDRGDGRDSDDNIRGGAKQKEEVVESIDGEVNMPDAPSSGEGGDATEAAKKRSKMGKESTISTTSQGLLGSAKTRRRSLMSGLIS